MWVWWWPSNRGAGTNRPQGVNRGPELCESPCHRPFTGSFGAQFGRTLAHCHLSLARTLSVGALENRGFMIRQAETATAAADAEVDP